MNEDYIITVKLTVRENEDKQEAIDFVADNIGLSEFVLKITAEQISNEKT